MAGVKIKTWLDANLETAGPDIVVNGSIALASGVSPGITTHEDNERGEGETLYNSSDLQVFTLSTATPSGTGCNLFSYADFDWSNTTSQQTKTLYLGQWFRIEMDLGVPNWAGYRPCSVLMQYKHNTSSQTLQFNVPALSSSSTPKMIADECYVTLWNCNVGGQQGFAFAYNLSPDGELYDMSGLGSSFYFAYFSQNFPDEVLPERPGGETSTPKSGGYGTFNSASDSRTGATVVAAIESRNSSIYPYVAGGFNMYFLTASAYYLFCTSLWGRDSDGKPLWEGWDWGETSAGAFNPLNSILKTHLMPGALVSTTGTSKAISASGYTFTTQTGTTILAPTINAPIVAAGPYSISFDHYFDSWQDFAPYTQMILHLPYCGVVELDVNSVMYGTLEIVYAADSVTGTCCAWVICTDREGKSNVLQTVSGNCAYPIPIFNDARNAEISREAAQASFKQMNGMFQTVSSVVTGDVIKGLSTAGSTALNSLQDYFEIQTKPRSVSGSGSFGSTSSFVGDTMCWLEIIRPTPLNPMYYEDQIAIPAEIGGSLSGLGCSGFTKLHSIDLSSINATQAEKDEIVRIVTSGFYIQ